MTVLPARDGYRLWASEYDNETAVSYLENRVIGELGIYTNGCALLDVGCGTGRRLRNIDAALAIGVDLSLEMLAYSGVEHPTAAADARALPFPADSFDVVWCRLMIGQLAEIDAAYAELARVCRTDGVVIVSDLSREASLAGHRRTFRDAHGEEHEVEHFVHTLEEQTRSAMRAGLQPQQCREGVVGLNLKQFYAEAGRLHAYEEQRGMPLVMAVAFEKRSA